MAAVDDQTVAGQQGGEGRLVWVDEDLGLLVVQPFTDQREPCLVDRLLGAEQQPVPVRAVRPGLGYGEVDPVRRVWRPDQVRHQGAVRRVRRRCR